MDAHELELPTLSIYIHIFLHTVQPPTKSYTLILVPLNMANHIETRATYVYTLVGYTTNFTHLTHMNQLRLYNCQHIFEVRQV